MAQRIPTKATGSHPGRRGAAALAALLLVACHGSGSPAPGRDLFDGRSLEGWRVTPFGGEGEVAVEAGALVLDFGSPLSGITWDGGDLPTEDYELEVVAARLEGTDFFCGLTFPIGAESGTLILGGWGGSLVGLSCIDGQDASRNETTSYRRFDADRDHRVRVRVDAARVRCWLDGECVVDVAREGHTFQLRPEVLLSRPLGIATFATRARVREVRLRSLSGSDRAGPEGTSRRGW